MGPRISIENVVYRTAIDAISSCDLYSGFRPIGLADIANGSIRQESAWMSGADRSMHSPLHCSITTVLCWRTQEQVVGTHARRIIATMADEHAFGNRAESQNPSDSMSACASPVDLNDAVPQTRVCTNPEPAISGLGDAIPKMGIRLVIARTAAKTPAKRSIAGRFGGVGLSALFTDTLSQEGSSLCSVGA
jgi:hypothetical protein